MACIDQSSLFIPDSPPLLFFKFDLQFFQVPFLNFTIASLTVLKVIQLTLIEQPHILTFLSKIIAYFYWNMLYFNLFWRH